MSFRGRGRGRGFGGSKGNTRFTGKRSGRGGASGGGGDRPAPVRQDDGTALLERFEEVKIVDEIDDKLGFWRFESNLAAGESKDGWLVNMHQTLVKSDVHSSGLAAVDYYFIQDDGGMFKATIPFEPYFYVACRVSFDTWVELTSGGDGGYRGRVAYEALRGVDNPRRAREEVGPQLGELRVHG